MGSCCSQKPEKPIKKDCCGKPKTRPDIILWGSLVVIIASLVAYFSGQINTPWLEIFTHSVTDLLGEMWWGLVLGIFFVSILGQVPKSFVMKILGDGSTFNGILRAALGGILLDLCSHGILLVGMQLYKKGASIGQVMAFLIASPWNSFSLTLILWALIGFWWMLTFLVLSFIIALISGVIFNKLVEKGVLPKNSNTYKADDDFQFWSEAKKGLKNTKFNKAFLQNMLKEGISGSQMILKWIFFGVVLASLIRTFVSTEYFTQFFGPTMIGLAFTVIAATIIEVCSEGSAPIGADLLNRAGAPGNSFTFLMTGVATDYTEIMVLKETTKRWKIALFLPLITVPQVILIGWILNNV
jgi:hypothetical protein